MTTPIEHEPPTGSADAYADFVSGGGAGSGQETISSEFGHVRVYPVGPPYRRRLCIDDLRTGQTIQLDALELESLAWAPHSSLAPLLDPSATRWVDHDTPPHPDHDTRP